MECPPNVPKAEAKPSWACPVLTSKSFNQKEVGRFWVPYKRAPSLIQMRWGPRKGPTAYLGFFESYTPPTGKVATVKGEL